MLAGPVIAILVVALLVLVLWVLRAHGQAELRAAADSESSGKETIVVRTGEPDQDEPTGDKISTPQIRVATRHEMDVTERSTVRQRRFWMMVSVILALAAVWVVSASPMLSNWWLFVSPAILGIAVAASHANLTFVETQLEQRLQAIESGNDEKTTVIEANEVPPVENRPRGRRVQEETSIELSQPMSELPSVSKPLPMSPQTYVNKPVLPRSMWVVDLSAGKPSNDFPVSADKPQEALPFDWGEAVGS